MDFKFIKKNKITFLFYNILKKIYHYTKEGKYNFFDNRKNYDTVCIVIAGYKNYLYHNVFARLIKFLPANIDVCIVSSGLYDDTLKQIAVNNSWSYLYTKRNCVTLAQNIAIGFHQNAKYIYKMDEDIFVTKKSFETMMDTYKKVSTSGDYNVGFVAPLIPINGYGHLRILKKLKLVDYYETHFERPIYASYNTRFIEKDPAVAKFFWSDNGVFPKIDILNDLLQKEPFQYTSCPIRFSIGFILFTRESWDKFGRWEVPKKGSGMGLDEVQICSWCMSNSKAIIIAENTVVGHLSFGQQNFEMKKYYEKHNDLFNI